MPDVYRRIKKDGHVQRLPLLVDVGTLLPQLGKPQFRLFDVRPDHLGPHNERDQVVDNVELVLEREGEVVLLDPVGRVAALLRFARRLPRAALRCCCCSPALKRRIRL